MLSFRGAQPRRIPDVRRKSPCVDSRDSSDVPSFGMTHGICAGAPRRAAAPPSRRAGACSRRVSPVWRSHVLVEAHLRGIPTVNAWTEGILRPCGPLNDSIGYKGRRLRRNAAYPIRAAPQLFTLHYSLFTRPGDHRSPLPDERYDGGDRPRPTGSKPSGILTHHCPVPRPFVRDTQTGLLIPPLPAEILRRSPRTNTARRRRAGG